MIISVVKSSKRKNSNSNILAAKVLNEISCHEIKLMDISGDVINNCRGCFSCAVPGHKGYCVIKDDMHKYYDDLFISDIILFVSPIYWFNISGQAKQFIDRCLPVASIMKDGASVFAGKSIASVFVFGDDDVYKSGCINAIRSMQDMCTYTNARWLGAVYGSANNESAVLQDEYALEEAIKLGRKINTL